MHAAYLQYTKAIRECFYTEKQFDALKLMEDTEIPLLWVATRAHDRNRAVKDSSARCSARSSEKACLVVSFATLIKIYIISFGLDFFVYDVMRSRKITLH
jgi:hypothetical protein